MTSHNLVTLPLFKRIEHLRRKAGSHDKLAAQLDTSRQTVIGWEHGAQPGKVYRERLAEISGLPAEKFLQHEAEREVWTLTETRLKALEAKVERLLSTSPRAEGADPRTVSAALQQDVAEEEDRQQPGEPAAPAEGDV